MTAVLPDVPWATCGIGSLGHEDPDAAVACVLDAGLDLPFWPQLPRRGAAELMVPQAVAALGWLVPTDARASRWQEADSCGAARGPVTAAFDAFVQAASARRLPRVKGQWAGPATVCATTLLANGETLGEDPARRARVCAALATSIAAQTQSLLATGASVDLWIDEPLIATASSTAELAAWRAGLAAACGPRVRLGVHCCAPPPPALFELGFDVVSFDARAPGAAPPWLVHALRAQLERGVVAWGLVDSEPEPPGGAAAAFAAMAAWCRRLRVPVHAVAPRSLITPACGFAALDAAAAAARFAVLAALQAGLRSGSPPA